jgi:excisionase family DNA binding protein
MSGRRRGGGEVSEYAVLFRVPMAGELLAVSSSTVYRLVKRGELPAVRRGRSMRIRRSDLVAFVERKREESRVRGWFAPGRPALVLTGGRGNRVADEAS